METLTLIISCCALVITAVLLLVLLQRMRRMEDKLQDALSDMRDDLDHAFSDLRRELTSSMQATVASLGDMILKQQSAATAQSEIRFKTFETANEQKLEAIRQTIERRLVALQAENAQKLDEMRTLVDEKLQKTLETKVAQSFRLVSERLEQVYKGLGEMQTLAVGVGDLKKVLSNVKTRGILGEIQLGAILEEILAPEQYDTNVATKPGSADRVEYAIKLPADDDQTVYLPIDSKFPADLYAHLQDAYESGSAEAVALAVAQLVARIKQEAAKIRDKYIDVPNTTEFAILFLPFEGLYAEVVNRGLVEELQRAYRINIAGPSTMAAMLNSLQMGFRSFAIQKRSGEVWRVLGAVKTEFAKFGDVLASSRQRLQKVDEELETLIGARTRAISRKLRSVEQIDDFSAGAILGTQDVPKLAIGEPDDED